ncbi:MAG: hypothetical protein ACXADD_16720 [Candidatus Thorarchaeota archaeon]|jgi:hypothetical protein
MVVVFTSNLQQDIWPFPGLVADYIIPSARDGAGAAAPPIALYLIPAAVIIAAVAVVVLVARRR